MIIKNIYVDMDGVLANFMDSALLVNGSSGYGYPKGLYKIEQYLEITTTQFWRYIDEEGEEFWEDLDVCEGATELMDSLQNHNPIILTSPSIKPHCVSGKLKWLQREYGGNFRDYIFCPAQHKRLFAGEGSLLIDDRESNCREFTENGGQSILWPHIGNNAEYDLSDAMQMVIEAIN